MRGGAWNNNPQNVRLSNRNRNEPANRNNNIGFRCAGYAERDPRFAGSWAGTGFFMETPGAPTPLPGCCSRRRSGVK